MENENAMLILKEKTLPCRTNIPVWKAMKENGFSQSAYLTVRRGTLITDDEIIQDGDTIELIQVVSGG
jgi:sulfur carrier protein ThiS